MTSDLLQAQYAMVKQSRAVVFQFLETDLSADIAKPVKTFNDKTISYLYVHIANTYIAWAENFALNGSQPYYDQDEPRTLAQLQNLFVRVDKTMDRFADHFATDPTRVVKGQKWPGKYIETDAYGIFTHVITHEFHHKGQAMTMARLLGHIPPDTDVMRF